MTAPNAQQIELWNGPRAATWVRLQSEMDANLEAHGRAALDAIGIRPGESVLDVGCGCGATTLDVARRVGPRGLVVGLDISAPMLARAEERASLERLVRVRFDRADAQTASLGAARYDAVVSRFGVMFFDDPVAAFSNMERALRAGGRLAFVCWQSTVENPWITVPERAVSEIIPVQPMNSTAPGPFALADASRVRSILDAAGFAASTITPLHLPIRFGGNAREAAEQLVTMGPTGRALLDADAATKERAVVAVEHAVAPAVTRAGVVLDSKAWLVTARAGARRP
jgi:SAM-dependent methyltransferase